VEFLSSVAKKPLVIKSENISLFFLLEGEIKISYKEVTIPVEKGYFFLMPYNENYIISSEERAKLLIFHLEEKLFFRHKREEGLLYDIHNIKLSAAEKGELLTVKTNGYIQLLLKDCATVMYNGFLCPRYMQCKTEELLILLRSYYPNRLLARLFRSAFNTKIDFHEVIRKNKDKFFSVEEYAAATNLDRNTFRQKFKDTYGLNPTEWIKQERIKRVFQDLIERNKPIADIITEYKFSNFPNFIRFCNMHYKNTPGNIRKIMEGMNE
jgi:AraC-like DNA-binding protein